MEKRSYHLSTAAGAGSLPGKNFDHTHKQSPHTLPSLSYHGTGLGAELKEAHRLSCLTGARWACGGRPRSSGVAMAA